MAVPPVDFDQQTARYWSAQRSHQSFGNKTLILTPSAAPYLLLRLGLLNKDSSMNHQSLRKFLQINHLLSLMEPHLRELAKRFSPVRILDAGCGKSYLTFLLAWYFQEKIQHPVQIHGVDSQQKIINTCVQIAQDLGFSSLTFHATPLKSFQWGAHDGNSDSGAAEQAARPHAVFGLHACDTATDDALALGITHKADFIAVSPCCQAELARYWKESARENSGNPLKPIFETANIRREVAAHGTDMLRMLFVRSRGYEVTATEFIPSEHTPKNRLITAVRRGNFLDAALAEYIALKQALGGHELALERILSDAR